MENNNISRSKAKDLASRCGWEKVGNGNFFKTKQGDLVNITMCDGEPESRQFRLDCDYLVVTNSNNDSVKIYNREQLQVKGVSRIGPDGVKYYQANLRKGT